MEGAESALANDGQEAIDRLKASPAAFDALLMDLQMPVMDGLTATRLIRGELGLTHLPIIALTAGVLPRQLEEARRAGFTEILAKPVNGNGWRRCCGNGSRPGPSRRAAGRLTWP